MNSELRIKVLDLGDGDGIVYYQLYLTNGWQSTTLEFYGYDEVFTEFGGELVDFPKSIDSRLAFQIGEDVRKQRDFKWAYYLLLEVFCHEPNGASLISVKVKKFDEPPFYHSCEFYISVLPAALNRLGQGLRGWDPKDAEEYNWKTTY